MHDLDRTVSEFDSEMEFENEYEFEDEYEAEYENEGEYEFEYESDGMLSDEEEMELAAELLEVESDEELEYFLGKFIKKAGRKVKRFGKSSVGRKLGGMLKGVVKKALPAVGGAIGSFVAPGAGTAIGSKLGSMVGNALEMELDGIDQEDLEFETARRLVRVASSAANKAANASMSGSNPTTTAKRALTAAVKSHVPNIAQSTGATRGGSGTWTREGRKIILHNV